MKKYFIYFILIVGLLIRTFGLNWDQGYHLHPDERMIVMVVEKISYPDNLNPKFFAYGSFPIYLLKIIAANLSHLFPLANSYDYLNLIGRFVSSIFDVITIYVIYLICRLLTKSEKISLISAIFYATCIFAVQLSHFYAVDTILNCLIYLSLYFALLFYFYTASKYLVFSSIFTGLAFATKVSAFPILFPIILIIFLKPNKIKHLFLFGLFSFSFLFIGMPYAFLDFKTFYRQIMEQQAMTKDAYVFPYTLQYVKTTAYLYPLKNIFLWGAGPFLSLASLLFFTKFFRNIKIKGFIFMFIFVFIYFAITGRFAVKFMRYMLPLYPFICLTAALYLKKNKNLFLLFFIPHFFILLAFLSIYFYPNTRLDASLWLKNNLPPNSTILREHWDDGLPLGSDFGHKTEELAMYESDHNPQKWLKINDQLNRGDYLVIASNRLWKPITDLKDKYPVSAKYYQDLFEGKLNYQKVKEFTRFPAIFGVTINDQNADESFTVYDHPQVLIYKKI